jgi:hypothetical protein
MVASLIEAVKTQQQEITDLKLRIEKLESKNAARVN